MLFNDLQVNRLLKLKNLLLLSLLCLRELILSLSRYELDLQQSC